MTLTDEALADTLLSLDNALQQIAVYKDRLLYATHNRAEIYTALAVHAENAAYHARVARDLTPSATPTPDPTPPAE